jgi:hypothetical protein
MHYKAEIIACLQGAQAAIDQGISNLILETGGETIINSFPAHIYVIVAEESSAQE